MDLSGKSAALQQYLLLGKTARGAAAKQIVSQALSDPNVYVFAELLQLPNVKELANQADTAAYFRALQLFAYGTHFDYVTEASQYPTLEPIQLFKLQQLSLVRLAEQQHHISYQQLKHHLGIDNVRAIEDLVIDAIYRNLIQGKLDQKNQQLEVEHCMGRDVTPQDMEGMVKTLQDWCSRCQVALLSLEEMMAKADEQRLAHESQKRVLEEDVANARKMLKHTGSGPGSSGFELDDFGSNDVSSSMMAVPEPRPRADIKRSKLGGLRGSAPKTRTGE